MGVTNYLLTGTILQIGGSNSHAMISKSYDWKTRVVASSPMISHWLRRMSGRSVKNLLVQFLGDWVLTNTHLPRIVVRTEGLLGYIKLYNFTTNTRPIELMYGIFTY